METLQKSMKVYSWNGPMMGHLNSFSASGGGNLNKNFPKIQMPWGVVWGWGGDVEASIWLVHKDKNFGVSLVLDFRTWGCHVQAKNM